MYSLRLEEPPPDTARHNSSEIQSGSFRYVVVIRLAQLCDSCWFSSLTSLGNENVFAMHGSINIFLNSIKVVFADALRSVWYWYSLRKSCNESTDDITFQKYLVLFKFVLCIDISRVNDQCDEFIEYVLADSLLTGKPAVVDYCICGIRLDY